MSEERSSELLNVRIGGSRTSVHKGVLQIPTARRKGYECSMVLQTPKADHSEGDGLKAF